MKAIVCRSYGSPDVLKCEEVEKPIPGDNEVSIKVHAASVNPLVSVGRGFAQMITFGALPHAFSKDLVAETWEVSL